MTDRYLLSETSTHPPAGQYAPNARTGKSACATSAVGVDSVTHCYWTQSAMKIFVSCSTVPLRLEAHTSRLASEENIGKASNPG
jgi:hypothetical protein